MNSKTKDKIFVKGLENAKAGQLVSYTVEIVLAKPDIKEGGGFGIGVPPGFTFPQFSQQQKEGYVTVTSNTKAKLTLKPYEGKEKFIKIVVEEGPLKSGNKISICFGDKSGGGPGIRVSYQQASDVPVPVFRLDENKFLPASRRISFSSQGFKVLRCHLPATFRKNKPVKLVLVAEDAYGNRCEDFHGEIKILNRGISGTLPAKLVMNKTDKGRKELLFVPGNIDNFKVCCDHKGMPAQSNPCVKMDEAFPYNLYFGEFHAHTELSYDAGGSVDELYRYARDTSCLDFASASDHAAGIKNLSGYATHRYSLPFFDMADMPARWELNCHKTKAYHKPGRFVTFPGFEFTPSGLKGHRNIYFLEDHPEMVKAPEGWNTKEDILNGYIKGRKALVVPHHPPITWDCAVHEKRDPGIEGEGLEYADVDRKYQPVVEIYSKHGCSEYFGNPRPLKGQILGHFVRDLLEQGHKFGFIAGSDTHLANPGSSLIMSGPNITLQYRSGLAAVWAKELTRESLWEAVFNRRTFATTYNKTVILFYVNGMFMGEEGAVKGSRHISLKVFTAGNIIKIEIIKNNKVIFTTSGRNIIPDTESKEYIDKESSGRNEDFYYARITESEGEMSWSSPVWVRN